MRKQVIPFFLLLLVEVFSTQLFPVDAENISKSSSPSEDVSVAFNDAGEIGAVWVEKPANGNQQVYFSIRRNGEWSSPAVIRGQSGSSANPAIARGVNGGFVAVWHDQTSKCIRFSQYQGSWSTPITVSQTAGYDFGNPAVTTTTNGRIAVAWQRGNPTFTDIYVTIFKNGWSQPENVSDTHYASKHPDLAYGPSGEIYVVWQDNLYNPPNEDFLRTLITNDRGNANWTQPSAIDNIRGWCFRPVVAVNSGNDILSCYYYHQQRSYYATYRLNGQWQNPFIVSDVGSHQDHDRYIADVCPYGRNGFLFIYRDRLLNIFYAVVQDGEPAKAVALSSSRQSYHPSIDYNHSEGAVAAWTDRSGDNDVFVAIFDPEGEPEPPPPPPEPVIQPPLGVEAAYLNIPLAATGLKTELIINRNLFTIQYYWKVTWAFDTRWTDWGITLSKYRIYRKLNTVDSWDVLAEVNPSLLFYVDKDGVFKEELFDYQVRGVDNFGNEFYAYNQIRWAPNPANSQAKITIQSYNVYRKLSGQPADSFVLWKTVNGATNLLEDHSSEIRQNTEYDYALTAVSNKGKESVKAVAKKITGSTLKGRIQDPIPLSIPE
jgi:hypothetical protein